MHVDTQFSQNQHHWLKKLPFSVQWSWHLCWKSFDHLYEGFEGALYSTGLYVCLYVNDVLFWLCSSVICFKFSKCETSSLFHFLKTVLDSGIPLRFHINVNINIFHLFFISEDSHPRGCDVNNSNCNHLFFFSFYQLVKEGSSNLLVVCVYLLVHILWSCFIRRRVFFNLLVELILFFLKICYGSW